MTDERRPRLDPSTARIRTAVRAALSREPGDAPAPWRERIGPHLVAVSGGADSLALAAAAAFLHTRGEASFLAVTVDHGLQEGSAQVARDAAAAVEALGLPARVATAEVDDERPGGLEAAARAARYAQLARLAREVGAPSVLTGHTQDDQAETVLLGLLRGSGARSLSGMAPATDLDTPAGPVRIVRPLLDIARAQTRDSARAQGLPVWDDPMNEDPRFARVRARQVLSGLQEALGQDLRASLARTADLLREDADHLDAEAAAGWTALLTRARETDGDPTIGQEATATSAVAVVPAPAFLPLSDVRALAPAVRSRVLRTWLLARGVPASDLTADHVRAVREVAAASGAERREASVPGGGSIVRDGDRLVHRPD